MQPGLPLEAHASSVEHFLVGNSQQMAWLKGVAAKAAKRPSTVMLLGETGTGKEMLARYIHMQSPRGARPFIAADCTAFSETLFESQLFGHVRGSFTGAIRDTAGFIRSADGGTLFLDEIGELSIQLQAKLLRVLQERRVTPLGDAKSYPVDIRVISATHRNLESMVAAGTFRQDLYFRLQVIAVKVPPLRERREDIRPLVDFFLDRQAHLNNDNPKPLSDEAVEALEKHNWPGNIRELFNAVEHAHVLSEGDRIELTDLPPSLSQTRTTAASAAMADEMDLDSVIKRQILAALKRCHYRRTHAAAMLGIERRKLNRYIENLGITMPSTTLPAEIEAS